MYKQWDEDTNATTVSELNNGETSHISDIGSKSVADISVNELAELINRSIKPVKDDLTAIRNELATKTKAHDNRLKLLESDSKQKQERIETLESTVIEMQKFINKIDFNERKNNIIVTGLPESDITSLQDNTVSLVNDTDKVKLL